MGPEQKVVHISATPTTRLFITDKGQLLQSGLENYVGNPSFNAKYARVEKKPESVGDKWDAAHFKADKDKVLKTWQFESGKSKVAYALVHHSETDTT